MARFLKSCELLKEYRKIKPFKIVFKNGFNIVVGENGSGKSTLLSLLTDSPHLEKGVRKIIFDGGVDFKFLDTEKHNPRLKNDEYSETYIYDICSHFISHGEAMLPVILTSKQFKDLILLIDEPEAGISLQNQKKIFETLQNICNKNNVQVVMTTHSYVIIKNIGRVFNMDNKQWVSSEKYLKTLKI